MDDNLGGAAGAGLMAGMFGVMCIIYLAIYIYMSLCLYKIAQKCGVENAWLAWIPIVQIIPMLQSGGKPLWWILLLLIPLVNLIVAIIVWMAIAERKAFVGRDTDHSADTRHLHPGVPGVHRLVVFYGKLLWGLSPVQRVP